MENHVKLFVKAGKDGESYGACPTCQRAFMVLLTKAQAGVLSFSVNTVNVAKPPEEFRRRTSRLPAMVHGEQVLTDGDDIDTYLEQMWPEPKLNYSNQTAVEACLGVFSKFSFYVKDVDQSPTSLLLELKKIDDYFRDEETVYLCGSSISHLDCLVLPKLQHMRVVAKAFKGFDIPSEFSGLWRYLATAYSNEVFTRACPSDQEIIAAWENKVDASALTRDIRQLYAIEGSPAFSFDAPGLV